MKPLLRSFLFVALLAVASQGLAEEKVFFDIPEQPLRSALESYSSVTGQAVIYDADLVTALRSNAVKGMLPPREALRLIIEGRHLSIVFGAGDTFALIPGAPPSEAQLTAPDNRRPYFALVQHQIENLFCHDDITRPGGYRVALAFWLGTDGEVLRPRLLGSSGDVRRDKTIVNLVSHIRVEEPPPPSLPQPIVLVISPKSPRITGDCAPQ
jgi:hypothetical protein